MDGFRIRRAGKEVAVPDVESLIRLVRSGELRREDEVGTSAGWVRAEDVAALRSHLRGDPWAAWQDVDDVDAAKLYQRMVEQGEEEPQDLPVDAVVPVGDSRPARMVIVRRDGTASTTAAHPVPAPPVGDPDARGEVIDFPRSPPQSLPLERHRPPSRRPPGPPPLVRASRVTTMLLAGVVVLMLGYAWIRYVGASRVGVGTAAPEREEPGAPPSPALALLELETVLRNQLPATPKLVQEPGDLEDALLVELAQMSVGVGGVQAPVTKWVGRKQDEPKDAQVYIRFTAGEDLTRDLGAIALVVGKYKRYYRLDISVFELTEDGTGGRTTIDADQAEAFYLGRIKLAKFLDGITRPK